MQHTECDGIARRFAGVLPLLAAGIVLSLVPGCGCSSREGEQKPEGTTIEMRANNLEYQRRLEAHRQTQKDIMREVEKARAELRGAKPEAREAAKAALDAAMAKLADNRKAAAKLVGEQIRRDASLKQEAAKSVKKIANPEGK